MARVTTVNAARKAQGNCSKCGQAIKKGDGYRHASPGFRGSKIVRCLKAECAFRPSDLTTSKLATVYAAQEGAEDDVAAAEDVDGIKAAMKPLAEAAREVADEYREAAEAMGEAGYENEERADTLETYADEVENFEPDASCDECGGTGYLDGEEHDASEDADECLVCEGSGVDLDAVREEAVEMIGSLELVRGDLTENERGVILGLIRDGLRKVDRNRRSGRQKWRDEYDPTAHDEREALLRSAYRRLGGDPDRISNLAPSDG